MSNTFSSPSESPRGLLLVGHGTKEVEGTQQFFALADQIQLLVDQGRQSSSVPLGEHSREVTLGRHQSDRRTLVQPCLLEFQSPNIAEGWTRLVDAGVDHIDIVPLLLFSAGHAKQDIPEEIHRAAEGSPGVTYAIAKSLSRHPAILELVLRRIRQSIPSQCLEEHSSIELIMIGRGSHDPCARSDMLVLSELVRHRLRLNRVTTCFYAMAQPRFSTFLETHSPHREGPVWVFYPHLLFQGRLLDSIQEQVTAWAQRYSADNVRICDPLGPDPLVASAVLHRSGG